MLKILHRVNTIEALKNAPIQYGLEIDLHAYGNDLVVHHDPFVGSVKFAQWIKYYAHSFLILNIKEEGIEDRALEILRQRGIKNFFLLDVTFPSLIKLIKKGEKNIAVRVSDYEPVYTAISLKHKLNWVWLDIFNKKFPISKKDCTLLQESGLKICLVSPELHVGIGEEEVEQIKRFIDQNNIKIDAVCTKNPKLWEQDIAISEKL